MPINDIIMAKNFERRIGIGDELFSTKGWILRTRIHGPLSSKKNFPNKIIHTVKTYSSELNSSMPANCRKFAPEAPLRYM